MNEEKRIEYLKCLLKIVKSHSDKQLDKLVLPFRGESTSTLSQRFYLVLEDSNPNSKANRKSIILVVIPILLLVALSFCLVFEPYSIAPKDASYTVELTSENAYLIQSQKGGYDIYFNARFFGHVNEVKDSFSNLPIYKNVEEVPNNEKTK
jgi:hypothetical protein